MVLVIVMMTQMESMRMAVFVLPVWLIVLYVGFIFRSNKRTAAAE